MIQHVIQTTRHTPTAKYFIGTGKLTEIKELLSHAPVAVVLVNHNLSPAQSRNLEQALGCRVIDRTELILDIFAQRARTFEGMLQVELAQLKHLSTRLVRGWTHLERQKGGIGLRGPGEAQLETDRRLIRKRIATINNRLEKVAEQRNQNRRARQSHRTPCVALIGYTNAGKSTLFNRLTRSEVYVADQLFATLDPTSRRCYIPNLGNIILIDTVGFIRHLPPDLIKAFKATLEETIQADLLLHVMDKHDPKRHEHKEAVLNILQELGAAELPLLEVYNKLDLVPGAVAETRYDENGKPCRVQLSSHSGEGISLLYEALKELLTVPAL
jgi:GTP-binding protein HflX